jgi:hypothetical protein
VDRMCYLPSWGRVTRDPKSDKPVNYTCNDSYIDIVCPRGSLSSTRIVNTTCLCLGRHWFAENANRKATNITGFFRYNNEACCDVVRGKDAPRTLCKKLWWRYFRTPCHFVSSLWGCLRNVQADNSHNSITNIFSYFNMALGLIKCLEYSCLYVIK